MKEKPFSAARLTFARKRQGLTKLKLAKLVDVSSQAISDFENKRHAPKKETLIKLAEALDFPVDFFYGDDLKELSLEAASFRSASKITAMQRNSALSAGRIAINLNAWIEDKFNLIKHDLPDLRDYAPSEAALKLRQDWGLGESSIKNMIHLLESKGIRVYSLVEDSKDVDAFSTWDEGTPFIFLNTMKSTEHSRFDAAHELAHLVLHKHGLIPKNKPAEQDANQFASAFLMPEGTVRANFVSFPTLEKFIKLKHYWIVSLTALLRRFKDLDLLTDWQYRMLIMQASQKGYKKNEPESAEREVSSVLKKVFDFLKNENLSTQDIANDLKVSKIEIDKLTFKAILTEIEGGGVRSGKSKASLTLVDSMGINNV